MKTLQVIVVILLGAVLSAGADQRWFVEGTGGFWVSPDLDDFAVAQGLRSEEVDGVASLVAQAKAGVVFDEVEYLVDVAGHGGFFGNGAVFGWLIGGDASLRWRPNAPDGSFTIGPHAGFNLYPGPVWVGDLDDAVDFDPAVGGLLGIKMTFEAKNVDMVVLLDYMAVEFDVDRKQGTANRNELDMSGLMLQVGLQF